MNFQLINNFSPLHQAQADTKGLLQKQAVPVDIILAFASLFTYFPFSLLLCFVFPSRDLQIVA